MINKVYELFSTFQLKMPTGVNIASGALLLFGQGTHIMAGVAAEAQATTNPPYDANDGYLTVDFRGAFALSVVARTSSSPSAGAQVLPGDALYADGGIFDPVTGITRGSTIDKDVNGTFIGLAMDGIAAGQTATIRVILKNAA